MLHDHRQTPLLAGQITSLFQNHPVSSSFFLPFASPLKNLSIPLFKSFVWTRLTEKTLMRCDIWNMECEVCTYLFVRFCIRKGPLSNNKLFYSILFSALTRTFRNFVGPICKRLPTGSTRLSNMAAAALNDEIQSVSYYNIRHLVLHGYIAPFICLYLIWFYMLMFVYGVEEYFEASLIALAVIGLLQILVSLFCLWSVDVRCALTCAKVS